MFNNCGLIKPQRVFWPSVFDHNWQQEVSSAALVGLKGLGVEKTPNCANMGLANNLKDIWGTLSWEFSSLACRPSANPIAGL